MNFPIRTSAGSSRPQGNVAQNTAQNNTLADRVQGWLRMRPAREQHLRLIETLPLGPRRSVAMIECDGQRFLAGLGADGVTTLVPLAEGAHASQRGGVA